MSGVLPLALALIARPVNSPATRPADCDWVGRYRLTVTLGGQTIGGVLPPTGPAVSAIGISIGYGRAAARKR